MTRTYGGYTLEELESKREHTPWIGEDPDPFAAVWRDLLTAARRLEEMEQPKKAPPIGTPLKCLVCALEKPWALFHEPTGVAVCVECRDAKQRADHEYQRAESLLKRGESEFQTANQLRDNWDTAQKRISDLEAENAALREDKARLDWLTQATAYMGWCVFIRPLCSAHTDENTRLEIGKDAGLLTHQYFGEAEHEGRSLRQAIDAARGKEGE